ncbi:1-phosphofructokinase [Brevibacillus ginsengisoli]|uniref:1-phosphofructokinase n=1 Tax=Brevibacillus ginsengisoli TaxID=363854 RepID=UPI003CF65B46
MIYTVTLNPSIDYHVWVPALQEGSIYQVQKEWKVFGGKGLNVSHVLHILGMESTALGFIGGFTGQYIQSQLETVGIHHQFIPIEQDSRINLKIKALKETDMSGIAPHIPAEALDQLMEQVKQLGEQDTLVLAGSVPDSVPGDIYQTIMKQVRGRGVRVLLDAKGEALLAGLQEHPYLIKPNHHELGEVFDVTISTPGEAISCARKAVEMGAQQVIVSLAGEGAAYVNQSEAFIAEFPKQKAVNSIGAGDSMIAGFLYATAQNYSIEEVFRFAVAAGSATALSEGFCTREKIRNYLPEIIITKQS